MAKGPRYRVKFRRRREGRTNYRKRLKLVLSRKPRLVVRVTNRRVIAQVVEYSPEGDRVIAGVDSSMLKKFGWKGCIGNTPAAYLIGLLIAKKALSKGIHEVVLDIGLHSPIKGSKVFAALRGAVEGGLMVPHSPDVFPDDSRIRGEHIAGYYSSSPEKFTGYKRREVDPSQLPSHVDEIKSRIMEMVQ